MEDYVNNGPVAMGNPMIDENEGVVVKQSDIMSSKPEVHAQTSGGSMMGMPTADLQKAKAAGSAVPTAQSVATDNKIFNQVGEDRKPMWQPPKGKGIAAGGINVPKANPSANPDAELGTQLSQQPTADNPNMDLSDLPEEDKETVANNAAAIDEAANSDDPQEKKDVADNYFNKADEELKKKADSKWQLWATIASVALFALSGGTVPPINFVKMTGQEDAREKWNTLLQEKSEWESELPSKTRGTIEAGQEAAANEEDFAAGTKAAAEQSAAGQAIGATGLKSAENELEVDKYAKLKGIDKDTAKELAILAKELEESKQLAIMNRANEITQEQMNKEAEIAANAYRMQMESLGFQPTKEGFLEFMRATMGQSAFTSTANALGGIVSKAMEIGAKAAGL